MGFIKEDPKEFIANEDYDAWMTRGIPNKRDILFTTEAPLGYVAQLKTSNKIALAQRLITFQVVEGIINEFLKFNLMSPQFQTTLDSLSTGTTVKGIKASKLKLIKIHFPPLPEQRAIVAKIEQLFSELDNGIANLKAAKAKLVIYRQAVLKKAFEGELTRNTKIEEKKIGDFAKIISGFAFKKSEYSNEGVKLFQIANVSFNKITWKKTAYLPSSYLGNPKFENLILKQGDLVMALNRPMLNNKLKIGRLSNADVPSILYQRVGKFDLLPAVLPDYLLYFLQSPLFTKWLSDELQGVNIPFINQTKLLAFKSFPYTNCENQYAIVQEIETRLSVCDNILRNIEEGLEKAEALRQSILKKTFEGKLLNETELAVCRQQPDWEPAEKLLARIRRDAMHRVSTTTTMATKTATTTTKQNDR